jgi:hypothetical protein
MKREIDLIRRLLIDLETHGPECAISVLLSGTSRDADERVRYHLRLLIDAGLAKETERTNAGVTNFRLTNSGHEFLELARSDVRWNEAKLVCQEQAGGVSLTILRTILTKWSLQSAYRRERQRRYRRAYRPYYYRPEPGYRVEMHRYDGAGPIEDERDPGLQTDYQDQYGYRNGWERDGYVPHEGESVEPFGLTLPVELM